MGAARRPVLSPEAHEVGKRTVQTNHWALGCSKVLTTAQEATCVYLDISSPGLSYLAFSNLQ